MGRVVTHVLGSAHVHGEDLETVRVGIEESEDGYLQLVLETAEEHASGNVRLALDERSESRKGLGRRVRIIAVVGEGVDLVRWYERVQFLPLAVALSARRFVPHPI